MSLKLFYSFEKIQCTGVRLALCGVAYVHCQCSLITIKITFGFYTRKHTIEKFTLIDYITSFLSSRQWHSISSMVLFQVTRAYRWRLLRVIPSDIVELCIDKKLVSQEEWLSLASLTCQTSESERLFDILCRKDEHVLVTFLDILDSQRDDSAQNPAKVHPQSDLHLTLENVLWLCPP